MILGSQNISGNSSIHTCWMEHTETFTLLSRVGETHALHVVLPLKLCSVDQILEEAVLTLTELGRREGIECTSKEKGVLLEAN